MAVNPKSIHNLKKPDYKFGEPKLQRSVMVTSSGWAEFKKLAASLDLSISDLIEKIARQQIELPLETKDKK